MEWWKKEEFEYEALDEADKEFKMVFNDITNYERTWDWQTDYIFSVRFFSRESQEGEIGIEFIFDIQKKDVSMFVNSEKQGEWAEYVGTIDDNYKIII